MEDLGPTRLPALPLFGLTGGWEAASKIFSTIRQIAVVSEDQISLGIRLQLEFIPHFLNNAYTFRSGSFERTGSTWVFMNDRS